MAVTASLVLAAGADARPSPRAVMFDATGSRSTTEDTKRKAFHHLLYYMTFGDSGNGNWGDGTYGHYGAISGQPRNANYGPIASHVYEVSDGAGDQVFTSTVYVTDGATVDSDEQTITVYDPNGANGYDSTLCVETSTTGTGGPAGADYLTSSDYDAVINTTANAGATYDRILFKRGQTFNAGSAVTFDVEGPVHVGAWGSGAAPLIENSLGNYLHVYGTDTLPSVGKITFADLDFDGNSVANSIGFAAYSGAIDTLILRCDVHHFTTNIQIQLSLLDFYIGEGETKLINNGVFIHDCTVRNSVGGGGGNLVFLGAKNLCMMGTLFADGSAAEHVIRTPYFNTGCVGHCYAHTPASAKHTFKLHCAASTIGDADGAVSHYVHIHNSRFKGSSTAPDGCAWVVICAPKNGGTGEGTAEEIADILVDGCFFEAEPKTQRPLVFWAHDCTARNCLFVVTGNQSKVCVAVEHGGTEASDDNCEFYNNTCYSATSGGNFNPIYVNAGSGHLVKNNLGYAPNSATQDMISGSGSYTASNNSSDAQILVDPDFASATPSEPADFAITTDSYAKGAGTNITVLQDLFKTARIGVTNDMGMHQFTEGEYPWEAATVAATIGKGRFQHMRRHGMWR